MGYLKKIPFVRLTQDGGKEEPWPEPDAQKSSKKAAAETARKNRKTSRTADTLLYPCAQHHVEKQFFDQRRVEFKPSSIQTRCKFSERPKYDVQVRKPNDFNLDWVYSVPCGQKEKKKGGACQSWILLTIPEEFSGPGPKKKEWVGQYLDTLDWSSVGNHRNKRFICPQCTLEDA